MIAKTKNKKMVSLLIGIILFGGLNLCFSHPSAMAKTFDTSPALQCSSADSPAGTIEKPQANFSLCCFDSDKRTKITTPANRIFYDVTNYSQSNDLYILQKDKLFLQPIDFLSINPDLSQFRVLKKE